jgi:hypothetical protein
MTRKFEVKHTSCPVCGSEVEDHYEAMATYHLVAYALHLTPQMGSVMAVLLHKGIARHDELVAAMGLLGSTDEHAMENLKVAIARLRKQLAHAGFHWEIRNVFKVGYALEPSGREEAHRIIEAVKADFEKGLERPAAPPPTRGEVWAVETTVTE